MIAFRIALLFVLLTTIFVIGCSSSSVNPSLPTLNESGESVTVAQTVESNHVPWGFWSIEIDLDSKSVEITADRGAEIHFNVTEALLPPKCSDCFQISINSYDPLTQIIDVDVTLKNPTLLDGRDIRGIFYTHDQDRPLLNPDDWTALWDIPGGEDINPFKAFAKEVSSRIFAPDASHTENYIIEMTHFDTIKFAVDASWPESCEEPFEIANFSHEIIFEDIGSQCVVSVTVHDWLDDTNEVRLWAPEITGTEFIPLTYITDNKWSGILINSQGVQKGIFEVLISAGSELDGTLELYDKAEITIGGSHPALNLEIITPEWLNFTPQSTTIIDNYLYTCGGENGIHLFDISDPAHPLWIKKVTEDGMDFGKLEIDGDIAFTKIYNSTSLISDIYVYNVIPPDVFEYVDSFEISSGAFDFDTEYYCSALYGSHTMEIWDINPWESAAYIGSVDLEISGTYAYSPGITIHDGYAYLETHYQDFENSYGGKRVIDIDPPEDAHLVGSSNYGPGGTTDFGIGNGIGVFSRYYYLLYGGHGIIEIFDASTGDIYDTFTQSSYPGSVEMIDGYAYVSGMDVMGAPHNWRVGVIDCTTPGTPVILDAIDCKSFTSLERKDNYLYAASHGLRTIDYTPPGDSIVTDMIPSTTDFSELISHNGTLILERNVAAILDISDPTQTEFINIVNPAPQYGFSSAAIFDNTLYLLETKWYKPGKLIILDITDPDSPQVINEIVHDGHQGKMASDGEYLIVGGNDIFIYDINPPESAFLINTLEPHNRANDIRIKDGYAYTQSYATKELMVIDYMPPEDAHIVKYLQHSPIDPEFLSSEIDIDGNFLYILNNSICIIDITDPPNASIISETDHPAEHDISVSNGYAFCPKQECIAIFDVSSPDNPFHVTDFDFGLLHYGLLVDGSFAYATTKNGLEVIKLW